MEYITLAQGLSPRVRGNQIDIPGLSITYGSIPACAGEPRGVQGRSLGARVYPRVCGGTVAGLSYRKLAQGLSPRVRGNRDGLS